MKNSSRNYFRQLFIFVVLAGLNYGCAPYFHQPLKTSKARLGAEAPGHDELTDLPAPEEKIVAAVYKFRDQTGQYKPSVAGSSFSTAVTQGATSVLLRALEESGWFTVIERENLGNLLNERKIIRSSRAEYAEQTGRKEPMLPPLLFAGIVLEGGIISYDANMMTGGAGLRYFGAGASGQYREDRVTIYLRAISTSNGRVLKTVYTSKTVLSQQVDVGLFRFVKFKRLLETETGFTYNEPSEMAVKEAIEKAVQSLIIEGVIEGMWQFKAGERSKSLGSDTIDATSIRAEINKSVVNKYLAEKNENRFTDELGRLLVDRRSLLSIGFNAGGVDYSGDFANSQIRPIGDIMLTLNSRNYLGYYMKVGRGKLFATNAFNADLSFAEAGLLYRLFPKDRYTPYAIGGLGVIATQEDLLSATDYELFPSVNVGVGLEFLVKDRLGLNLSVQNHFLFSDNLDGVEQGRYNDYYWSGKVGINWYLGPLFVNKNKSAPR
ncbi:curli production assembly/transport component CsgG [Adhaeribacter sp. BT258]|uniref:Curli production assembly/transport component CsgG n=1 Tax=Adhaeribacter terrigena TaxID=2793070 RepID=A0ABS1C5S4_9BACT|nr:CsgG/HfaB family protein [Adhaeribacter terrigena]MBK0404734.1 curli production assembly/transport component CsgG [Adhaeribacter terrigena]